MYCLHGQDNRFIIYKKSSCKRLLCHPYISGGCQNIWGASKHMGDIQTCGRSPNIQEGCPNMQVSKHTGDPKIWRASKHGGSPNMWGSLNIWGHPNIQEGCPNMGVSKYTGVSKYGGVQTYGIHPNDWRVSKHIVGASKHTGDINTYGGIQTYRGHICCHMFDAPFVRQRGVHMPPYTWMPHMFGYSLYVWIGASKHVGGIQTYRRDVQIWHVQTHRGIQTWGVSKHMGCPNIQGASKHMGCPSIQGVHYMGMLTYRRASKQMEGVQTYRGYPNIWGHLNK